MTSREQAAFNAGLRLAREVTLMAAADLTSREGLPGLREQAAVEALVGLAEGLDDLHLGENTNPMHRVFAAIALDDGNDGIIECPTCQGRLRWHRDSLNGHLHGECETEGCLRWMQ